MEPLLRISIKAGSDRKSKKHPISAVSSSLALENTHRKLQLIKTPTCDSTQELFAPSLASAQSGVQDPALEACLKMLRLSENGLLVGRLERGSTYHKLEAFRRLTIENDGCEHAKIYDYISEFEPDDDNITNRFLEILSDFLLTSAYSQRHRPARMLSKSGSMPMLHRCLKNESCLYNALIVICILSHCSEIRKHDLGFVIGLLGRDIKEPSRRLCYKIVANLASYNYIFTRDEVETMRSHIESTHPKDPDASKDAAVILTFLNNISASFDKYVECLKSGEMKQAIEKGFWSHNIQRITENTHVLFPLFSDCLAHGNKELLVSVCFDLVSMLTQHPALHSHALESGIGDILLNHVNSEDEDIRYAAVQLLSMLTQCSLHPDGPVYHTSC